MAVFRGSAAAPVHLKFVLLRSVDRVPANAFAGETAGKRALADVARAAKAASGVDEAGHGVVRPAARESRGTGGEAADVGRVEAEADVAGRR